MFTGIIEEKGYVKAISVYDQHRQVKICASASFLKDVQIGHSISVAGACLTAVEIEQECFFADISNETLKCTTLGALQEQNEVNLERALTLSDRLGGHLVSGHVDGVGKLIDKKNYNASVFLQFQVPSQISKYIAKKGSICIDGVSLTVNNIDQVMFDVLIIPHTLEITTLGKLKIGTQVNIEVDLIARYVERLLATNGS